MKDARSNAWERFWPAWHAMFYVALALPAATVPLDDELDHAGRASVVALSVGVAALYALAIVGSPARRAKVGLMTGFVLVVVGIFAALARLHPFFLLPSGFFFGHVFRLLPIRRAIPVALGHAVLMAWRAGEELGRGTAGFLLATAVGAVFLGLFIDAIVRQSVARLALVEELQAARAELAEASRRAGALEERQRLAGEIHDTLTQDLVSIARLLEPRAADVPPRAIEDARRVARDGVERSRRLVWSLRQDLPAGDSLEGALRRAVDGAAKELAIEARLVVPSPCGALAPELEVTLLRTVQEALVNVRKHARARSVTVTLTRMEDRVAVDVCDDGEGFDPERAGDAGGFGLRALRDRVARLGGSFALESAPGEGTTVAVELPIADGALAEGAA